MSVLIYTENWDGKFKKLSYELVSYGSKIAEMLGTEAIALSIGNVADEDLKTLGKYGAKKVLSVKNDALATLDNQLFTATIAQAVEKENADVVVFSFNNVGKGLSPQVAAKLGAGLAGGVVSLPESVKPFTIKKRVFSGNAFANVEIKSEKAVVTLLQNSYEIVETVGEAVVESFEPALPGEAKTKVTDVDKVTGKILLTDAEIVVSGGRGMKSGDNWGSIEELAEVLGAATACSRPVSDEGWRPHAEHTGQTGKIIAPNLYIAAGISGAIQHLAGVSSSKVIVAINKDPEAPIFEAADYGIVGDALKVLPEMVNAVKEIKAQ